MVKDCSAVQRGADARNGVRSRYLPSGGLSEVRIQHRSGFNLATGHELSIAVKRDRDRRVAKVSAQGLGIQSAAMRMEFGYLWGHEPQSSCSGEY